MSAFDSALAQIKALTPYLPGKPVEELERELGIGNADKLASNENPLGCSSRALDAIRRASERIALYPDANGYYLKNRLAARLGVAPEQITLGNGSNDVLDLVARTFLDGGTEAVYSQYAFLVYAIVTQACGATARVARAFDASNPQAYGHDLGAMLDLVDDRTRVIFIANPNNPTGTFVARDELGAFIEKIPENVAIVVDEAYFEYVDLPDYPDSLAWLPAHPNLIVTRTFSKIHGLAGLRLGYAVSSSELADLFNRVRQPFNGNSVALAAAEAALDDEDFVARSRETNREGLRRMQEWLGERGVDFIPSVGNFVSVRFGERSPQVYQALLEAGTIVRPIANYGLDEYLRISVGRPAQLDRLFERLERLL